MQVAELVAVSTIVDLLWVECLLHSAGSLSYIGHEVVTLLIVELIEVIDVLVVADEATATVSLLFEEEQTRNTKMANLNHEIVQGLIVGTIETIFRIAVHDISYKLIVKSEKLRVKS